MIRDVSPVAEQAVLGALLIEEGVLGEVADLFRPELFGVPGHAEIAREILALAAEKIPADPILVQQRLDAKGLLGTAVPRELPLSLGRAIGTTANVRHYAEALDALWAKREAKRIMAEALRSDVELPAEEFVGSVAQKLSAIETRRGRGAQSLAWLMMERLDRREDIQKNPALLSDSLWRTGFSLLDGLVGGFRSGHLFTIAARPGVGKSAFVTSVADYVAGHGAPVGILQLEDYADAVADRALMRCGRIPSTLMRDGARWSADTWGRAQVAVQGYANLPVYVDDTHGRTIHDLVGAMRRMHREHGIRVFVLDNLAEVVIDRQERSEERLDRALGRIAKQYRDAAAALGAAPILIVHLNRDVEKRGDGKPRMSDLKNSGEIEDASHVVAMLSRPPESDALTVDVIKNRNGPPGEVVLTFDRESMAVRQEAA